MHLVGFIIRIMNNLFCRAVPELRHTGTLCSAVPELRHTGTLCLQYVTKTPFKAQGVRLTITLSKYVNYMSVLTVVW